MSSTDGQPRLREILISAVETLRRDDTLVGWLYTDQAVPTDPVDRLRIHEHDPGFEAAPTAQIAVAVVGQGSTWRGGQVSHTYVIQATIRVTDDYFERHTSTRLLAIRDQCTAIFERSVRASVYPGGVAGASSPHELRDGTHDRVLVGRWRVGTHWTTR